MRRTISALRLALSLALPLALLAAVAATAPAAAQIQSCYAYNVSFFVGQTVSTEMTVKSGLGCGFNLSAGGRSNFDSIRVTQQAKHGRAITSGTLIAYRSARGYRGRDQFTITITGHGPGGSAPAKIVFDVNVE